MASKKKARRTVQKRKSRETVTLKKKIQTGPEGGKYFLVKWYKSKPKRRQETTLFGESWHRPGSLKELRAAAKRAKKRGKK